MKNTFKHKDTKTRRTQREKLILTAETQVLGGFCPSTLSARTAFFPVILSLSKHLLSILTILIISACGGGGGSTGPSSTVTFSGSSSGDNVYMDRNSFLSHGSVLAVDVKVNNVSNVYGAAFVVDFDSSGMTYDSYAKGDFLGTVEPYVAQESGSSNKLVVGISKQGTATGATGSGTLITLKFNVTSGGNLAFSNPALKDPSSLTISGITWSGGTVTVP